MSSRLKYIICADPSVDIGELDIAVNAVATAVKDFFFKRLPPILGTDHMAELEAVSSKIMIENVLSGHVKTFLFLYSDVRSKHKDPGAGKTAEALAKDQLCCPQIHLPTFCQVRE